MKRNFVGGLALASKADKTFVITSNEESIEIEISKTAKIEPVIKF